MEECYYVSLWLQPQNLASSYESHVRACVNIMHQDIKLSSRIYCSSFFSHKNTHQHRERAIMPFMVDVFRIVYSIITLFWITLTGVSHCSLGKFILKGHSIVDPLWVLHSARVVPFYWVCFWISWHSLGALQASLTRTSGSILSMRLWIQAMKQGSLTGYLGLLLRTEWGTTSVLGPRHLMEPVVVVRAFYKDATLEMLSEHFNWEKIRGQTWKTLEGIYIYIYIPSGLHTP